MSKICYVGKFKRSSTGTEASIVKAMEVEGHAVECVDYQTGNIGGAAARSAEFDLAIFSKCEPVTAETIKSFECRKAMWIFDSLHTTSMDELRDGALEWAGKALAVDKLFTAAAGDVETYREIGVREVEFLPQACDEGTFFDRGLERDLAITFVGNQYGQHRRAMVKAVHEEFGGKLKLYSASDGWRVPVEGSVDQAGAADVFSRSLITLNISELPEDDKFSNRVWNAMGCGAAMLAEKCGSFTGLFWNEIVAWRGCHQLIGYLRWLTEDRDAARAIGDRGAALVLVKHTYRHRVKELFKAMGMDR